MKTATAGRVRLPQPLFKSVAIVMLATAAVLLVPLLAMQWSDAVVWTLSDFAIAGTLLAGTGMLYVALTRVLRQRRERVVAGAALAVLLALAWIELAVGVFGTPLAGS